MIGATQTNLSVLLRRCTIYTIELTSRASSLAFIGTVLAMVMVLLELCGVLRSQSKPHLVRLGLGSFFLMFRASTLCEPSSSPSRR